MLLLKQIIFPVKIGNYIITARTTKVIEVKPGHSEKAARLRRENEKSGEHVYRRARQGRRNLM